MVPVQDKQSRKNPQIHADLLHSHNRFKVLSQTLENGQDCTISDARATNAKTALTGVAPTNEKT